MNWATFFDVQVSFGTGCYSANNKSNILVRVCMEYPLCSINSLQIVCNFNWIIPGYTLQGQNRIVIESQAGMTAQKDRSIVINKAHYLKIIQLHFMFNLFAMLL